MRNILRRYVCFSVEILNLEVSHRQKKKFKNIIPVETRAREIGNFFEFDETQRREFYAVACFSFCYFSDG